MRRAFELAIRPVASIVILGVILELALRAFGPFLPGSYRTGPMVERDDVFGWRNIPFSVTWYRRPDYTVRAEVNADGRVGPRLDQRTAEVRRVLLLGDSYIAGTQVPYERSLASLLTSALGPSTEVVNDAVIGYGTDQELLRFEAMDLLAPTTVVLAFAVPNDVWNNDWILESRAASGPKPHFDLDPSDDLILRALPPAAVGDRLNTALGRSMLISVVRSALIDPLAARGLRRAQLAVLAPPSGEWATAWRITDLLLERFGREARGRGVPAVLLLIPDPCQVLAEDCGGEHGLATSDLPQRRLTAVASSAGLRVLDLLPTFRDHVARGGGRLYYATDIHWNVSGHALAARLLADALNAR